MLLTAIISMIVYIFWFIKSEFSRVVDRIDQSTLGLARLQREVSQSMLTALNEQINESLNYEDEQEVSELGEEEEDLLGDRDDNKLDTINEEEINNELIETAMQELQEGLIEREADEIDAADVSDVQEVPSVEEEEEVEDEEPKPRKRGRPSKK